ncbi:MAG: ABC transporter ATP-binding protein [Chloroflexi bacterium]|nr:ABC transporter ATP-binding protein [Chloroflexota bacterium]
MAIETRKLSKSFGELRAVQELDLAIEEGEIFGFLGSNGAGKTTTISMLTGQLRPSAGAAWIMGQDVTVDYKSLSHLIGVVFEFPNLYLRLSAYQNLYFAAQLYDVPGTRIDELLERMGLTDRAHDSVYEFSSGMKQKLVIARALLHQPRVLFLDEPTSGLDPTFARGIRELVRSLREDGTTIFLTTHYMDEAEQLCDRVAFIEQGEIACQGAPSELKREFGKPLIKVELRDGKAATLSLESDKDRRQLAVWSEANALLSVHSQEASLEDVFVEVVGRPIEA